MSPAINSLLYQRREPLRVTANGIVHPRDPVQATVVHVPLITQTILRNRIKTLAHYIAKDHWGKSLQLVPILNGAVPFANVLVEELRKSGLFELYVEPVRISSYNGTASTGKYTLHQDLAAIHAPSVLIVDGIVDTGGSAKFLIEHLQRKGVTDIGVCALLHKKPAMKHILPLQYVGFEIPDVFIVGFGMDRDEQYRELPYVARLK